MKYAIFFLMNGEAKEYRDKLVEEVGPQFGEHYVLDSKLPAHATLKGPFVFGDIGRIEEVLENFAKKHKKQEMEIQGFGNFSRTVAFMDFKVSKPALKVQNEMINELRKIGVQIDKNDEKWNPHATISYGNVKGSFDKIWNYLKRLDKPHFDLMFDNITIMKRVGKYWEVHKEFNLK